MATLNVTHGEPSAVDAARPSQAQSVPPLAIGLLGCAFFLSGVAGLAFETLWFRQASLAFGNSVWASAIVLSGFMGGMACGYVAGGSDVWRRVRPLRLFALLETIVAISGCALVVILPELPGTLARLSASLEQQLPALNALRLVLSFALLLVPAAAMGMSLPVVVSALSGTGRPFARIVGNLYGINTLGAVLGSGLCELAAIRLVGVRGSALLAGACNLLAAGLALGANSSADLVAPPSAAESGARTEVPALHVAALCAASFLSGFVLLALEVVWLRYLTLFVNDTDLAFTWLMICALSGIALGALGAALWASVQERHADYVALGAWLASAALIGGYYLACHSIWREFRFDHSLINLAAQLILPTALASGFLFTLLGAGLGQSAEAARATGRLALWNTLGGMVGSLSAGFVLLPQLGVERSLFTLAAMYAAAGVLLALVSPLGVRARVTVAGACLVLLALFPHGQLAPLFRQASVGRWMRPGDEVKRVVEGPAATYSHVVHTYRGRPLFDQLATNAYSMSVNDFAARRYMDQFVVLPRAVHPKLERALVIGYGIGNTVAALIHDTTLKHVDVADISREALALSREMHTHEQRSPLDDPRVQVHVEDGRHFLAGHTDTAYDLITGEPPPPIIAGVVNLYTREYFELMRARLAPGGMASYWLPLMNLSVPSTQAIIGAFCEAFHDCSLWHGSARNFMLLGTRDAQGPVSDEHFVAQWKNPEVRAELIDVGIELPEQLGAAFIADAPALGKLTAGMPPLTDDHPKRVNIPGEPEAREAFIWTLRDTQKSRARFVDSPLIKRLWPETYIKASLRQFENQRLINDLLFSTKSPARQTMVLHQVIRSTPLMMPVWLILQSDSDVQRVVEQLTPPELARREWQMDLAADRLAQRDFQGALPLVKNVDPNQLPLPDLPQYVEMAAARAAAAPQAQGPADTGHP